MYVTVNADGVPFLHDPSGRLRISAHILPDHKESRLHIPFLQNIQYPVRILLRRTVVKSQIHCLRVQVSVNSSGDPCRQLVSVRSCDQPAALLLIGEKSGLDQAGRHRAFAGHTQFGIRYQFPAHSARLFHGLLLDQLRQPSAVPSRVGSVIPGLNPCHAFILTGILMDAHIEKGIPGVRIFHPVHLIYVLIALSGQFRLISHLPQPDNDPGRDHPVDILLHDIPKHTAAVHSAVSGVDDDHRCLFALRFLHGGLFFSIVPFIATVLTAGPQNRRLLLREGIPGPGLHRHGTGLHLRRGRLHGLCRLPCLNGHDGADYDDTDNRQPRHDPAQITSQFFSSSL